MTTWMIVHSVLIAVQAILLYLTIRQIGVLLSQGTFVGARQAEGPTGPRVGENVALLMQSLHTFGVRRDWPALLVFGADSCPVRKEVDAGARVLGRQWREKAEVVLVHDSANPTSEDSLQRESPGLWFGYDKSLRVRLAIENVPYAVMIGADGTVLGHGLVNNISHVESLLELLDRVAMENPILRQKQVSSVEATSR